MELRYRTTLVRLTGRGFTFQQAVELLAVPAVLRRALELPPPGPAGRQLPPELMP